MAPNKRRMMDGYLGLIQYSQRFLKYSQDSGLDSGNLDFVKLKEKKQNKIFQRKLDTVNLLTEALNIISSAFTSLRFDMVCVTKIIEQLFYSMELLKFCRMFLGGG